MNNPNSESQKDTIKKRKAPLKKSRKGFFKMLVEGGRLRFSFWPFPFVYEFKTNSLPSSENIDKRIASLSEIKSDLLKSVEAVEVLQKESSEKKQELENLQEALDQLEQEKSATEKILNIKKEDLASIINDATKKSRLAGLVWGFVIGMITGVASGILVWLLINYLLT